MKNVSVGMEDLAKTIQELERILRKLKKSQRMLADEGVSEKTNLENLIGTIPFLLLNQSYFEKNQDIAVFARSLGIHIPSPEKKKREDMIGRIVSAIATFDNRMIDRLNDAITTIKRSGFRGKSSFFLEWEKAIRQMNL